MGSFFKLVFELFGQVLYNIVQVFVDIFNLLIASWVQYWAIFISYFVGFSIPLKIAAIILAVIFVAIPVGCIYFIFKRIKLHRELKFDDNDNATLYREIGRLNRQVLDLIEEKNKILAIKVNSTGANEPIPYVGTSALISEGGAVVEGKVIEGKAAEDKIQGGEHANIVAVANGVTSGNVTLEGGAIEAKVTRNDEALDPTIVRFPKLTIVDDKYKNYQPPVYNETITLQEIAEDYRLFAASQMGLYYTPEIIRRFIAGMASSKLLILEGISGTGKTSLPYSFSRFLDNPATMVSVQPSFRDRTELLGYFNEFSKRFNETEFLRALYEASYRLDPSFIVLDEMNLARIEYYFAEMLSVLEMPSHDEWVLDLVPTKWPKDPVKLDDGKIHVTDNMWFVGTANNDDSTFTITDKVYDRAIPIEINERADAFECEKQPKCHVSSDHLQIIFERAKHDYPVSNESVEKLNLLDEYLQTRFKMAFGNRIIKQMYDFVPVYVACGGDEVGGMDYIIARKVLKKFESMNVMFVRDEIKGLIMFIEKTFGKNSMPDSVAYLTRIQNLY